MRLMIIDPAPPEIRCAEVDADNLRPIASSVTADSVDALFEHEGCGCSSEPGAIAYVLHHGGDAFVHPIVELEGPGVLERLSRIVRHMPDHNTMTLQAVRKGMMLYPNVPHLLLCETGVFAEMPSEASSYAIPPSLRDLGIRRYGLRGLAHLWAARKAAALKSSAGRLVSVMLAPATSVSAFRDGNPIETSTGFTPIEGVPSITGCGEIDPTIVLHLKALGMRISDINLQLTERSGLQALAGEGMSYRRLLESTASPRIAFARDVYTYHLIKQIGAMTAALGGADAIAFFGNTPGEPFQSFVRGICEQLAPSIRLRLRDDSELLGPAGELTSESSPITVYFWATSRWDRLAKLSAVALQGGFSHAN